MSEFDEDFELFDDDDEADPIPDRGPCCLCGEAAGFEGNPVRTFWMLPVKLPDDVPHGWGCFGCGLEARGANAVLCDRCAERGEKEFTDDESWKRLTHYCAGNDSRDRRPIAELFDRPRWAHDMSKHREEDRRYSMEDSIL